MNKNQNHIGTKLIWIFLAVNFLATAFCIILYSVKSDSKRIVYVDAIKVMSKYHGTERVKKNFQHENELRKANLDTLRKEYEISVANFENSKNKKLTTKTQLLLEQLVSNKQKQYVDYEQVVNEQYQKQEQTLSLQLLSEVNDYLRQYGEQKGYDMILAATNGGNIAYAKNALDVTEDVLKGLNSNYTPPKK